ncbi:two-component sensor histidine kinase [Actinoplanes philippinensis]|uniref:histidine kinase n=1 Tax=Actinoplanes philippinensis TaxID=35752 RepID=A0A1I2MMB6_9ACTN|nr:sensor histidine kinase [Actinoplanes philippinensis]GIE82317.1 two-component sensor histidine kinase [Actinoplanes philippinensis]SFF92218.1 Signal transduction histidine kinase [Actinoplanes philippinensis]
MRARLIEIALIAAAAADIWVDLYSDHPVSIASAVVACAALAVRRRFALAVVLLTLPATLLEAALVAPCVALYTLAERSRNRVLLSICVVLAAIASAAPSPLEPDADPIGDSVVYFVYALATVVLPVLLGQLVQTRHDLSHRLEEIEEVKEHERVLHAQAILAEERAQLAREMHDVVSHQVSLIAVQAGALQVSAGDEGTREAARTIRSLSVGTLDELRTMVTLLRASGDDITQLTPQPTLADLCTLIANSGIDVDLTGDLGLAVGTPRQRAIYRTVQEALTNVRKHAPGAVAAVELWHDGKHVGVTVTNGPPTRPSLPLPGAHQGLIGLQERADLLGGTLESGPTPDGGYRVRMRLPIHTD